MTLSHTPLCVVSPKEKKSKRKVNINNNLAIEEAVDARGFPVFFLNRSFPNYYLSSSKDKSLNKDKMCDLLRKAP